MIADRDLRKRLGVFYTPEPVARYMAATSVTAALSSTTRSIASLRVVDPACGDGALLWPAYQFLCEQQERSDPAARWEVVRWQLFGVDLDAAALARLRQRWRDEFAKYVTAADLEEVLQQNFRCGNAVNGCGWETPASHTDLEFPQAAFHWSENFPQVCAAGGFDVVIANPPYRRERGAKSDLEHLAQSPLALSRRQARRDLWHYFFHRSLDLLRPAGVLTFIVNSYWTESQAGKPLIARMAEETTPLEFVQLERAPVFADVDGRHLIVRLRKGITPELCRMISLSAQQQANVLDPQLWANLSVGQPGALCNFVSREELFLQGRLNLAATQHHASAPLASHTPTRRLGDVFEVRQGIAENPPRVTRRQATDNPEYRTGEGVFVLTADELADLGLSVAEMQVVRPYYTASEISRYWSVPQPQQWLLYLTRQTAPDLTALPRIERHLSRFRPLLMRRRETQLGKVAWWHLHWPREERLFERPRILAVQMVPEPRFAYVESPTYVGFSVNLIAERPAPSAPVPSAGLSLEVLAMLLNSRWATAWFDAHAKRRGIKLDITGGTLKQFPLPDMEESMAQELSELGIRRRETAGPSASTGQVAEIERQMDALVDQCYQRLGTHR